MSIYVSHTPEMGSTLQIRFVIHSFTQSFGVTYSISLSMRRLLPSRFTRTLFTSVNSPSAALRNRYRYGEPVVASKSPEAKRATKRPQQIFFFQAAVSPFPSYKRHVSMTPQVEANMDPCGHNPSNKTQNKPKRLAIHCRGCLIRPLTETGGKKRSF